MSEREGGREGGREGERERGREDSRHAMQFHSSAQVLVIFATTSCCYSHSTWLGWEGGRFGRGEGLGVPITPLLLDVVERDHALQAVVATRFVPVWIS